VLVRGVRAHHEDGIRGAPAVQIVYSSRRGSRKIEHLGSAHDRAELEALKAAARQRLAEGQGVLDLGLDAAAEAVVAVAGSGPLPITSSRMGHLWDALSRAYDALGFDEAARPRPARSTSSPHTPNGGRSNSPSTSSRPTNADPARCCVRSPQTWSSKRSGDTALHRIAQAIAAPSSSHDTRVRRRGRRVRIPLERIVRRSTRGRGRPQARLRRSVFTAELPAGPSALPLPPCVHPVLQLVAVRSREDEQAGADRRPALLDLGSHGPGTTEDPGGLRDQVPRPPAISRSASTASSMRPPSRDSRSASRCWPSLGPPPAHHRLLTHTWSGCR
jgi:hypothetical protein